MYGFIYITTNTINGKRYLGQCKYNKTNVNSYLGSGKALRRAIRKYGSKSFRREIIHEAETKEELIDLEVNYIQQFNCVDDPNWYNISPGGFINRGFLGRKHSEETKQKMKRNHRRPLREDSLRKMSEKSKAGWKAGKNKPPPTYYGAEHPTAKRVQINGVIYDTISQAMNETGISYYSIRKYYCV